MAEDQAYGPGWSTVAGLPQPRTGILAPPSVLLLWLHVLAGGVQLPFISHVQTLAQSALRAL